MAAMTLDELVRQLGLVYGSGLQCVALYGSAARGEQVSRHANLNVLVIVDAIDMESLRREGGVARAWQEAGHPPPLTLTMTEWLGSADVFSMEYADILAHNRVVHGTLPVSGVSVSRQDLRLQLEHESRSKLLRLRHAVLSAAAEPKEMARLLEESVSAMMVLLRAALRVAGEEPPPQSDAMLDRAAVVTSVDVEPFRVALRHSRREARLKGQEAVQAVAAYIDAVAALAEWVDQHPVAAPGVITP
jgi:hypothetical protein